MCVPIIDLQLQNEPTDQPWPWSPQYYTVKGTPPDSLVLRIIQPKTFSTPAIAYGIENEKVAVEEYITYRQYEECKDIVVTPLGVIINSALSFLGASSDWAVYYPSPLRSLTDSWRWNVRIPQEMWPQLKQPVATMDFVVIWTLLDS